MKNDVLKYFREISEIPRGSGNEKGISDYLVAFAEEHGLDYIRDEALNVIIKKKASQGYEVRPKVVLQSHMDMVCEKNEGKEHDFTKDPISLKISGDMIYADGTTLGADNGIGMAIGLAVLASDDRSHPGLEALFTTDEERGMKGAEDLDPEMIEGRILINIDSDQEGKFFVSCAGGPAVITSIPLIWEKANANTAAYAIKIRGLLGGHSGSDIDKGRANSNKLMGRILKELETKFEFSIASLSGGMMYNAIPREANAVILIRPEDRTAVSERIAEMEGVFRNEYRISDPDIEVVFEADSESATKVFSQYAKTLAINYLYLAETGINTMSASIPGLVESSISIGVVRTAPGSVDFTSLIRSSVNTLHKELLMRLETLAEFTGADVRILSDCHLWEYNPDSKIRKLFERVYSRLYNMEAEATAIHVGLECGIFDEKFNGEMDMISFGPDVYEYHTPDEHLNISSAERSFDFLSEVLKEIE